MSRNGGDSREPVSDANRATTGFTLDQSMSSPRLLLTSTLLFDKRSTNQEAGSRSHLPTRQRMQEIRELQQPSGRDMSCVPAH